METKKAKIIVSIIIAVVVIILVAPLANSLFGNPVSLKLAEKSAKEYIEKEYPDSDCVIEDVYFDGKYADYVAHVVSPTKGYIDFSLYLDSRGEIKVIEYWKSPDTYAEIMTEEQIKELYLKAHKLYAQWFSPSNNLVVDWENITKIDGVEYFSVSSTDISTVDELKTEFGKYFNRADFDEIIDRYYVMHNGKMYGNAILVEGGDVSGETHKMTIKVNTNTECEFTITSTTGDYTSDLDFRLKVVGGEWKFAGVFHWITLDELVLE